MFLDKFGTKVEIGDKVVYNQSYSASDNICRGVVTRLTATMCDITRESGILDKKKFRNIFVYEKLSKN